MTVQPNGPNMWRRKPFPTYLDVDTSCRKLPDPAREIAFSNMVNKLVASIQSTAKKGPRYKALYRTYSRLVIAPPSELCDPVSRLNTLRLLAAQAVIQTAVEKGRPEWALDLAETATIAPRDRHFPFTHLDAWRIAVDYMHAARRN